MAASVTVVRPRPKLSAEEQAMIDALPIDVLTTLTASEDSTGRNGAAILSGHRMRVHLFEARDLPATTYFSSDRSDTYAILSLQASKSRVTSKVVRETRTPQYNEVWDFQLSCRPMEDVLHVALRASHSIGRDDFLGRIEVPLSMILSLPAPRKMPSCWFKLLPDTTQYFVNDKRGSVRLGFEYFFDPSESQLRLLHDQATALAIIDSRTMQSYPPSPSPASSVVAAPPPMMVRYAQPQPQPVYPQPGPHMLPPSAAGQPPRMLVPVGSVPRLPPSAASLPLPTRPVPVPQDNCPVCNSSVPVPLLAEHVDAHFRQQQQQQQQQPQYPSPQSVVPPVDIEEQQLQQALRESEQLSSRAALEAPPALDPSLTQREVQLVDDLRNKLAATHSASQIAASAPGEEEQPLFRLDPTPQPQPQSQPQPQHSQILQPPPSHIYYPQFQAALYPPPGAPRLYMPASGQPIYPAVPSPLFPSPDQQQR